MITHVFGVHKEVSFSVTIAIL